MFAALHFCLTTIYRNNGEVDRVTTPTRNGSGAGSQAAATLIETLKYFNRDPYGHSLKSETEKIRSLQRMHAYLSRHQLPEFLSTPSDPVRSISAMPVTIDGRNGAPEGPVKKQTVCGSIRIFCVVLIWQHSH